MANYTAVANPGSAIGEAIGSSMENALVELTSNLKEVKFYEFDLVSEALEFLQQGELQGCFLTTDSTNLFDLPPKLDD